uniref:Mannosyltransferase n=2 Tax=Macrostomum lignano TaxID=282301 RepID=A0A1I8H1U4_9PLAT
FIIFQVSYQMSLPIKVIHFIILLSVSLLHIYIAPYNKVEESFNLQATHDILYHGYNLSAYDHKEFPGPVPRTFLGPLALAAAAAPARLLLPAALGLSGAVDQPEAAAVGHSRLPMLFIVRALLAAAVAWSLADFAQSLGPAAASWFVAISASQFHLLFYASRTLPNTFAMALALPGLRALLLDGDWRSCVRWAGLAGLLFRSELGLLFGPPAVYLLATGRLRPTDAVRTAAPVAVGCAALTVAVDSVFWGRLVWPELSVLLFNTWQNKSSLWGTQPFLWYFYSALPRCLLFSAPLALASAKLAPRARPLLASAVVFVLAYSCLPHKELRFVLYSVPLFNASAACACDAIFSNRRDSPRERSPPEKSVDKAGGESIVTSTESRRRITGNRASAESSPDCPGRESPKAQGESWESPLLMTVGRVFCLGHLLGNAGAAGLLALAAAWNYPGGEAVSLLHTYLHSSASVHVHLCNLAAQTGASRFLQLHDAWIYNKTEGLNLLTDYRPFSHVIAEPEFADAVGLTRTCRTIGAVSAFDGFNGFKDLLAEGFSGLCWHRLLRLRTALLMLEKPHV